MIQFRTTRSKSVYGETDFTKPEILLSLALNHHLDTILMTTAHEMVHLLTVKTAHDKDFLRISKTICRDFGWDLGHFVGGV